jgi:predicted flap endonuclease-1-like 5' DNA nuclease
MAQGIDSYWIVLGLAVVLVLLVSIWLFVRSTAAPRERHRAPDALDEGAAPAQRNQALIDARPAAGLASAALADTGPDVLGGMGEVIAVAAQDEVDAAKVGNLPRDEIAAAGGEGDDLRKIKGLGPKLVGILAQQGVTRFDQIAAWSDADVDRIDATLGTFAGRIRRDNWVEQAKFLAAGDLAGFEGKFGKL